MRCKQSTSGAISEFHVTWYLNACSARKFPQRAPRSCSLKRLKEWPLLIRNARLQRQSYATLEHHAFDHDNCCNRLRNCSSSDSKMCISCNLCRLASILASSFCIRALSRALGSCGTTSRPSAGATSILLHLSFVRVLRNPPVGYVD